MAGFPRFRRTAALLAMATGLPCVGCQSAFLTSVANVVGAHGAQVAMSETEEEKLGAQSYAELIGRSRPTSHAEYQAVVEKVGRRIADASGRSDFNWEFTVLEGPSQNAMCLPGGKVVVYDGLLPLCENEAGLAAVMSHEIGHMIARHGGERMKDPAVVGTVGAAAAKSGKSDGEEKQLLAMAAYGARSPAGVSLPYSRSQETQADSIGLMIMARAGYNPEESPLFWRRFQSGGKSGTPELLSMHPSDARRIDNLVDLLSQAERYYAGAPNKLDRGANIAKLQPTTAKVTVAKVQSAAPATSPVQKAEVVTTTTVAPPATEPSPAKPAPAWIGAAPASAPASPTAAPQEQFFSEPESQMVNDVEPENPFFTPAVTPSGAIVSDSGWTPTVH